MEQARNRSTAAWIDDGVRLLDLHRFHDAHHAFEQPWRYHETPLRLLCQALVQVAAAGYHLSRGHRAVALTLIRRALPKLAGFVPEAAGLRVDRLVADLEHLAAELADPAGAVPADRRWPRIELVGGDRGPVSLSPAGSTTPAARGDR